MLKHKGASIVQMALAPLRKARGQRFSIVLCPNNALPPCLPEGHFALLIISTSELEGGSDTMENYQYLGMVF